MKVIDVMHTGVTWVAPDMRLTEIAEKMRDEDIGSVPVGENDRLIGMVTDRDITCRGLVDGGDIDSLTARDVMTKEIVYCRTEDDVEDATHLMEDRQIRRLPVIDENKRIAGMLSLGDLSHAVAQELSGEVIRAVSAHHD